MKVLTPGKTFIGRSEETEALYKAEERRNDAVKKCAIEYGKLKGKDASDLHVLYGELIPQSLFDLLDNYDPKMVKVVVDQWLHTYNAEMKRLQEDEASERICA